MNSPCYVPSGVLHRLWLCRYTPVHSHLSNRMPFACSIRTFHQADGTWLIRLLVVFLFGLLIRSVFLMKCNIYVTCSLAQKEPELIVRLQSISRQVTYIKL